MTFNLLQVVSIADATGLPGVLVGDVGTVVEVYPDACEVEFANQDGETQLMLAVPVEQLTPVLPSAAI